MPTQQFFSYILARMRFSMKWWWGPLCTRPTRLVGFLVLVHWNSRPQIDKSPHSDTLSWFRANQSLLFLLNAACLAEKQQILLSSVWPDQGSNPRSTELEVNTFNITSTMRSNDLWIQCYFLWYISFVIYLLKKSRYKINTKTCDIHNYSTINRRKTYNLSKQTFCSTALILQKPRTVSFIYILFVDTKMLVSFLF
jgi:hypothetical protein